MQTISTGSTRFVTLENGLILPNGLGWSPDDRHMYLTGTAQRTIFRYDYDAARSAIGKA